MSKIKRAPDVEFMNCEDHPSRSRPDQASTQSRSKTSTRSWSAIHQSRFERLVELQSVWQWRRVKKNEEILFNQNCSLVFPSLAPTLPPPSNPRPRRLTAIDLRSAVASYWGKRGLLFRTYFRLIWWIPFRPSFIANRERKNGAWPNWSK